MIDITRYEVNEHGELPVSYGRYVRWEDVQDLIKEFETCQNYSTGYDDGWAEGYDAGREDGKKYE